MKDGKITLAEKKAQVEKRQDIQKKMLQQRNNIDDYKEQLQDYADNLAQTQQVRPVCPFILQARYLDL
jgi:hypothetical protein